MAAPALDILSPKELRETFERYTNTDLELLTAKMRWRRLARKKQLPPEDNKWDFFGIKSGRGFGKTVSGARWLVDEALADPGSYNFVVAPTHDDLIKTCFYGPTGIHGAYEDKAGIIGPAGTHYPVLPPKLIKHSTKSPLEVTLANEAKIMGFSAEVAERLRGPQCFPGETLVTLADGTQRRIDTIRVGQRVLTRKGPRKVTAAWCSGRNIELWQLGTNNGATLRGTMKHPVWVDGRGFVPLWQLTSGAPLCTTTGSNLLNVKTDISYTRNGLAPVNSGNVSVLTSIVTFLRKRWGQFLRNVTYTTKTETVAITVSVISKRLPRKSMLQNMLVNGLRVICNGLRVNMLCVRFGRKLFGKLCAVIDAVNNFGLERVNPESFVACVVATPFVITPSFLNTANVLTAYRDTEQLNRFSRFVPHAVGVGIERQVTRYPCVTIDRVTRVEKLATRADVYDLTVEDEHEFFANGILVHNCHRGWLDEVASWREPEKAFDNFIFGLRLGKHPQVFWTGTPKPKPFIKMLMNLPRSITISGSTYENAENLSDVFYENIAKYEGTRIGRQEIYGEVIDPEEAGFVKRSDIRLWPAKKPLPKFRFVVMSLDTAFTEETWNKKEQTGDPTACTVWGLFEHERRDHIMLLDAWEEYLGFPQLIRRVKHERAFTYGDTEEPILRPAIISKARRPSHQGRPIDLLLIEDTGSGKSLIQMLAVEGVLATPFPTDMDKLSKLHGASPLFAHGRIWAVESLKSPGNPRDWAEPVVSQLCTYVGEGSLAHDDLLDTATQALLFFMRKFNIRLTVRTDPIKATLEAAERLKQQKRSNPYDG